MNPNNSIYKYPSWDPIAKLKQEMKIRKFSQKTIKSYLYYIMEILRFASKSPREINQNDVKDYIEYLYDRHLSSSTLNTAYSALKFYFEKVLKRTFFIHIPRAKQDKKLPLVLSKKEVIDIIDTATNIRHKLMVQILYASGLRVSEIINLKINNIDFIRKIILVQGAKGKKDRITVVPEVVLKNIKKYLLKFKPQNYLFESQINSGKLTTRTIQKITEKLAKNTGINKTITPHVFRHSFATHLLEQGVGIRYIQSLLGHARLETTQIYTKVAINKFNEIEDLL